MTLTHSHSRAHDFNTLPGNIYQTGEKKASSSFSVYKGVNAFDVSKDYIVSGGLDTIIRVWHYSMTNKPTATMKVKYGNRVNVFFRTSYGG